MAAKKRSGSKLGRARQAIPLADRSTLVLSIAMRSVLNMAAVVLTSGTVLLCLLTAKRFL
jgi:hypothetical protein